MDSNNIAYEQITNWPNIYFDGKYVIVMIFRLQLLMIAHLESNREA